MSVKYFSQLKAFVTCSQDSTIKIWKTHGKDLQFTLKKTLRTPPSTTISKNSGISADAKGRPFGICKQEEVNKQRKVVLDEYDASTSWPEDFILLTRSMTLAVACSNRVINFFETNLYILTGRLRPLESPPTCLAYNYFSDESAEALCFGDHAGSFHIYLLEPNEWKFPDTSHHSRRHLKQVGVKSHVKLKLSLEALTKAIFVENRGLLVTSSVTGKIYVANVLKGELKQKYDFHKKTVLCCTYFKRKRLMISSGRETKIVLWNPFTASTSLVKSC